MKNALIVGAGGFVGAYLIDCLFESGRYEVVATKVSGEALESERARVITLDIGDRAAIDAVLDEVKPDVIFHLAAISSVAYSWKNPQAVIDVNIKGTLNLLEAVKDSTCKPRVLLVGSGEEYGCVSSDDVPIVEETYLRPGNIYAATKAFQGMLGSIYADAYGMDIISVRAFNHIGPGQAEIFVVSDFCKQVVQIEKGLQEPVICVGNLAAKRDFTDVRDVVRAYVMLVEKGESSGVYNVGSGVAVSIESILEAVLSKSQSEIKVEVDEAKFRPIDVPLIAADVTSLKDATGWQQEYSLDGTIEEILAYWRAQF